MAMNYDKLWKLLIDKKMNRTDLHEQAHVSTNAIANMGKGGDVSTKVLDKICKTLDCQIHDIVDYVPDKDDVQEYLGNCETRSASSQSRTKQG